MVPPTQLSKTIEVELSKYRKSSIGVSELSGHYRTSIGKVLSNYRAGAQERSCHGQVPPDERSLTLSKGSEVDLMKIS